MTDKTTIPVLPVQPDILAARNKWQYVGRSRPDFAEATAATGITDGELLRGVRFRRGACQTQSLVMRSKSGTVRLIEANHHIEKLDAYSAVDYN